MLYVSSQIYHMLKRQQQWIKLLVLGYFTLNIWCYRIEEFVHQKVSTFGLFV